MNTKCKYIIELEKKLNEKNKIFKILIGIVVITFLLLLHIDGIKGLFLDSNGGFSNEIFWSAVSGIGSIVAFAGVIYTIWYTEKTRRIQNEYEYKKQRMIEEQMKFKEQVFKILLEIDPACVIEIMTGVDENNFFEKGQELTEYSLSIKKLEYKLYWCYNKKINTSVENVKLTQFVTQLNVIIKKISECINGYNNELVPIYYDWKMRNHFSEIIRLEGRLEEKDQKEYNMLKDKYPNGDIINPLLQKINDISRGLIEYRNKNWNDFVELGKEVVDERENIVEEILRNI